MKTLEFLLDHTPKDVQARARHVSVNDIKVTHAVRKLLKAMIFTARCHAITDGKNVFYDIMVELYPDELNPFTEMEKKKMDPEDLKTLYAKPIYEKPNKGLPAFVKCSCPYFLFH